MTARFIKSASEPFLHADPHCGPLFATLERPAPVPDDALHVRAAQIAAHEAMLDSLPHQKRMAATIDGALARILAQIGAAIYRQERESHKDTQSLPDSFIKGRDQSEKHPERDNEMDSQA